MRVIISVFLIIFLSLSLFMSLDESAMLLLNDSFKRAMIAFGIAKSLNGVISLLQGTEISLTPLGIGMNLSIGEILDPFNDIVERFSWIMLFATIALGLGKLFLILSAKFPFQVLLFVSTTVVLFFIWYKNIHKKRYLNYALKTFFILLILRFGVIFFVYSSELLYNSLMKHEYIKSSKVLQKTQVQLEKINIDQTQSIGEKKNLLQKIQAKYSSASSALNMSQKLENMKESIEVATQKIISLMTIFVFQTIVFPFFFFYLLFSLVKYVLRKDLV